MIVCVVTVVLFGEARGLVLGSLDGSESRPVCASVVPLSHCPAGATGGAGAVMNSRADLLSSCGARAGRMMTVTLPMWVGFVAGPDLVLG